MSQNNILHVCQKCITEHRLRIEEGYQSIRPCCLCVKYKNNNSNKPTNFVRTTIKLIEMNKARRDMGYQELAEVPASSQ